MTVYVWKIYRDSGFMVTRLESGVIQRWLMRLEFLCGGNDINILKSCTIAAHVLGYVKRLPNTTPLRGEFTIHELELKEKS